MIPKPLVERVGQIPVREARYVPTICDGNVPLQGPDQVKLFVDLTDARGGNRIAEVERRIRWAPPGTYEKHLVTGHAGSGKTTELNRLATALQRNNGDGRIFHVVVFDINQRLDPSDIQLPDLIAALFSALWTDPVLNVPTLAMAKYMGKQFVGWAKSLGLELGGDLAKDIPVLGTLLKNADLQRRFREKAWDYTARLIENMGDLIQEVRNELVRGQIDDIVIVIDNLEKMLCREVGDRTNYEILFIEQLPKLEALPVHMVMTFPVSLHADQARLRAAYANAVAIQIPMVRVRERVGHRDDAAGLCSLREFLARRLELTTIFSDAATVDEAIRASGGCVRDLLRIVASAVVERGEVPIDSRDIDRTVSRLAADLERVLQGRPLLSHLHTVERTGSLPAEISPDERKWLLQNLIVIEYNGEVWYDVHPLARRTRAYAESAPKKPKPDPAKT